MAVKIRLKRMGKIRAPYYRIVVADSRTKRDGRVIEQIGKYHPKLDPSLIEVDSDRAQYWLGVGAQPSEPVMALLRKTGDWQQFKGEPAPPPLLVAETSRDRNEIFNEALKESSGEPATEAVTRRRPAKKAAPSAEPAAEAPEAEAPAAEAPEAEARAESADEDASDAPPAAAPSILSAVASAVGSAAVSAVASAIAPDKPRAEDVPADAVPTDDTPDGATAAAEQAEVKAVDAETTAKQD